MSNKRKSWRIIITIAHPLMKIISYLFPLFLIRGFKVVKSILYSYYLAHFLKKFGKDSLINYPCTFQGIKHTSVGSGVHIGKYSNIIAIDLYVAFVGGGVKKVQKFNPQIILKNGVSIGESSTISTINTTILEDNVLLGRNVTINDNSHGNNVKSSIAPDKRPLYSKGGIHIKKNVWIGDKVTILGGVTIGENSIVGANSVVTKDIPPNCIAVGSPAKVIKMLEKFDK
ncbi:MAG: acyltransferase [Methanobrevibacter sp.]|nr:acyltransferase [Candidatus Methanovirga aequatorialis]